MTAPHVHPHRHVVMSDAITWGGALLALVLAVTRCANGQSAPAAVPRPAAPQSASKASLSLPPNPTFDVASIHPNKSDHTARTHIMSYADQGHFVAINATPMQLLQYAWALADSRILAAPDWTRSSKFDIEAKSDPAFATQLGAIPYDAAKTQLLKMVQALLNDRFHLASHMERRHLPIYNLVVAKRGPKFSAVKDEGTRIDVGRHSGTANIQIKGSSHAMADLAEILARYTGRVVIDKTGLTGTYTLALQFAADDSRAAASASADNAALVDSGPSVFTALKDQLGLELKSGKAAVDVLVIDHIDPPTEN